MSVGRMWMRMEERRMGAEVDARRYVRGWVMNR